MSSVIWESTDPRTNAVVAYDQQTQRTLEQAFQDGSTTVHVILGSNYFTIDITAMRQYNQQGLYRSINRRVVGGFAPAAPTHSAPVSQAAASIATQQQQQQQRTPQPQPQPQQGIDDKVLHRAIQIADSVEAQVASLQQRLHIRTLRAAGVTAGPDANTLLQTYQWILEQLSQDSVARLYGGSPADQALCFSQPNTQVEAYFANAGGGSIYRRKVLSILGLRNLVLHGADIFNELFAKLFSGNPGHYTGTNTGLSKMKHFTGNTVDLDTVVLNPARQLNDINQMLLPKPGYKSSDDFERSQDCRSMVIQQATPLIEHFVDRLRLSPAEIVKRNLQLPDGPIHVASGNDDRGRFAVWHYRNVGVSTYHVNVPNIEDVFGALLLAPVHLAKAFAIVMTKFPPAAASSSAGGGNFTAAPNSKTREGALKQFFEDGISDSCFNGKWKAIEAFLHTWETLDTIPILLGQLQQDYQQQFVPFLNDADRQRERALMLQLVMDKQLVGQDEKTKCKRRINAADVDAWIAATD